MPLRKLCGLVLFVGAGVLLPRAATAEIGAVDAVPAATLLLPRFEVDLANPTGLDTLFSVNNASDVPALAHVTVWTELSIPVLDFDIYLTGYDVQTISMRDIIVNGNLPRTGENVSNLGLFSTPGSFPGCNTGTTGPTPPIYDQLPEVFRQFFQEALAGRPLSIGPAEGLCTSVAVDTDLARGYLTIDSVSSCSLEFPSSATYFSDGGAGVANNNNVLWGDWFLVDRSNDLAWGETLVHIEASADLLGSNNSCDPLDGDPNTFYCRYTAANGIPGADNREALGTTFAVRYLDSDEYQCDTDIICWREGDVSVAPGQCSSTGLGLASGGALVFDEAENPVLVTTGGPSGLPPPDSPLICPNETNRMDVGETLTVDSPFGWVLLDLGPASSVNPGVLHQAHVGVTIACLERVWDKLFGVGFDALQLDNLTAPIP